MSGYASDDSRKGAPVRKSVWMGEEMEMEHQRQKMSETSSSYAAVDLSQFRNNEVGKGYQAKHVVRQATSSQPKQSIKDVSSGSSKKRKVGKDRKKSSKSSGGDDRLTKILKSSVMRRFRTEVEKIEASDRANK